jgi:uncharacterized protein (DUF2384 family)
LLLKWSNDILSTEMPDLKPATAPDPAAVVTKAVLRAADNLELSARIVAKTLGVSEATVSRLKAGQRHIGADEKAFELAALFVRLYRSLDALTGGDDAVSARWMANPNTALQERPAALIQSVEGLMRVIQYLDSRRALV